jgi:hypothetical protein
MRRRTRPLVATALVAASVLAIARRGAVTRILTKATGTWVGRPDWPAGPGAGRS